MIQKLCHNKIENFKAWRHYGLFPERAETMHCGICLGERKKLELSKKRKLRPSALSVSVEEETVVFLYVKPAAIFSN